VSLLFVSVSLIDYILLGAHKDRHFFICGMDKTRQCDFFVWADSANSDPNTILVEDRIASRIWQLCTENAQLQSDPLHLLLFRFAAASLQLAPSAVDCVASEYSSSDGVGDVISIYQNDSADGALCANERIECGASGHGKASDCVGLRRASIEPSTSKLSLADSILEFLAHIAGPCNNDVSCWYEPLCRYILQCNKKSRQYALAKRGLLQLCGQKPAFFLTIRDHFCYMFQIDNLAPILKKLSQMYDRLKRKAQFSICSWKVNSTKHTTVVTPSDYFNLMPVFPEDTMTLEEEAAVTTSLSALLRTAKKRPQNWTRFCGPTRKNYPRLKGPAKEDDDLLLIPQALCLLACSTTAELQVKALQLIHYASRRTHDGTAETNVKSDNSSDDDSLYGNEACRTETDVTPTAAAVTSSTSGGLSQPQAQLAESPVSMSSVDLYSFAVRFVCNGETMESRKLACSIATSMCLSLHASGMAKMYDALLYYGLAKVSTLGSKCIELFILLQNVLSKGATAASAVHRNDCCKALQSFWQTQVSAMKSDRSNELYFYFETRSKSSMQKKRFDLTPCYHCTSQADAAKRKDRRTSKSQRHGIGVGTGGGIGGSEASPAAAAISIAATAAAPLPPPSSSFQRLSERFLGGGVGTGGIEHIAQSSVFVKTSLESCKAGSSSTDFCAFYALKYRLSISHVHVDINDPRGRLGKYDDHLSTSLFRCSLCLSFLCSVFRL
jgi:hypothetical protein